MLNIKNALVAILTLGLTACASPPFSPIKIDQTLYQNNEATVGVYVVAPERADTYLNGASCLLCYAAAAAANGSLTKHMRTLDTSEFTGIRAELVSILEQKGLKVQVIDSQLQFNKLKKTKSKLAGFSQHDFTPLKTTTGVDKLLVVEISMLGAQRLYSGYVPTSSPIGAVSGKVFIVDLATNKLDLDQLINERVAVQGEWDEPTSFPGVTTAYYEALEKAKMNIKQQL